MYVLGIETSCDETSAAVVQNGRRVLSNVVASSLSFHKKYGGVVPEIASRKQVETITPVVEDALSQARLKPKDIGLLSVTSHPGLPGSLLAGRSFAEAAAFSLDIPLLEVNHVYGHIYSSFLNNSRIKCPVVALVVSGGHTSLFYVKRFNNIQLLGQSQDDACGEAFDKVARILGLPYPGGPYIEKLAKRGEPKAVRFKCSETKNPLDFSFSGIKTAVLYLVKKLTDNERRTMSGENIAASFQETVINTLIKKALLACKAKRARQLVLGGGVVANKRLREKFKEASGAENISCYFPEAQFCLDNAAMIAGLGYHQRLIN